MIPHADSATMRAPWLAASPNYKLIVDFFAGGGGASLGIEMATGRSPDIAVNHDAEAVALHRINHPASVHLQNDVWSVFPALDRLIGNRPVGLFHASPDCKHFSKAKGGRPVKRKIRDLAWVVPRFCRRFRPEVVTLENVEEFAGWGPLAQKRDAAGLPVFDLKGRPVMVPCKRRKGQTFQQWVAAMQRLGYRVEWRERRAYHDGAPTIRRRLFVIARRDGRPIVWPAAQFENPADPRVGAGTLQFGVAAAGARAGRGQLQFLEDREGGGMSALSLLLLIWLAAYALAHVGALAQALRSVAR
jgi:DNA (cytosine-5)-methyltransferase 1